LVKFVSAVEKTRVDVRLIDDVKQLMNELRQIRQDWGGPTSPMGPLNTLLPWSDFDLGLP
jgi:hypothetical protein